MFPLPKLQRNTPNLGLRQGFGGQLWNWLEETVPGFYFRPKAAVQSPWQRAEMPEFLNTNGTEVLFILFRLSPNLNTEVG